MTARSGYAREGCDVLYKAFYNYKIASIHAPARGATRLAGGIIHSVLWFQFTHPRGVRRSKSFDLPNRVEVSIHAPARGATQYALGV